MVECYKNNIAVFQKIQTELPFDPSILGCVASILKQWRQPKYSTNKPHILHMYGELFRL